MIIKTFDNGWGPEYPAKQLETQLLTPWYNQLNQSSKRVVVINSVWYTGDYHQQIVVPYLEQNSVDLIVLVAMLDAAIPRVDWFDQYAQVVGVGYYPGAGFLDYWALFLSQYFQEPHVTDIARADKIDLPFMCLNRKPHWHRLKLYNQVKSLDLHKLGLVSLGSENGSAIQSINNDVSIINLAPNSGSEQNGIPNDISSLGNIFNWQRCFFNVVTETVHDISQHCFVSEKIYKPILGMRPFVVYAPDGGAVWLTERGFETYFDEFSDITDLDISRPENTVAFLKTLSEQPKTYWQKKFLDLSEKLVYNKNHFSSYVNQQKQKTTQDVLCLI